jgi:hypothetical protein
VPKQLSAPELPGFKELIRIETLVRQKGQHRLRDGKQVYIASIRREQILILHTLDPDLGRDGSKRAPQWCKNEPRTGDS